MLVLLSANSHAEGLSWLSGTPPTTISAKFRPSGMQHYLTYRERGVEKLILWYRQGNSPANSIYLDSTVSANPEVFVFSPQKLGKKHDLILSNNGFALTYDFDEEGYHNIYIVERWVENSILHIHVAKAERLSHKCLNGHKKIKEKSKVLTFPQIPFDIIRKRFKGGEDLHLILESGDVVDFLITLDGMPVKNAKVSFTSQDDWEKVLMTDSDGIASFQIIADYFSKWKEFQKDKTNHFLVTAEYAIPEGGLYEEQPYSSIIYTATYAGDYIPSKTWYESNASAMIIFFASLLVFSLAIFIYRWKFKRPY